MATTYFNLGYALTTPTQTLANLQLTLEQLAPVSGSMLASVASAGTGSTPGALYKTAANTIVVGGDSIEAKTAAGAISVTARTTTLSAATGTDIAMTLAVGTEGMEKFICDIGLIPGVTWLVTSAADKAWNATSWRLGDGQRSLFLKFIGGRWAQMGGNAEVI